MAEKQSRPSSEEESQVGLDETVAYAADGNTVPNPHDPLNWPAWRKNVMLLIICIITFLSDYGATAGIPAVLPQAQEWRLSVPVVQHSLVGMLFTLGAGGVFIVALAAYLGRLPVLFAFQVVSLGTGVWCAVATSFESFMAARIINGFFATLAQAGGLMWIQDLYFFHEHPRKINIWVCSSIAAPYIGPMVSSFVIWRSTWRWGFWIFVMINGISLILTLLFADETFYNRKVPQEERARPHSRIARFVGIEQRKSGHLNTAVGAMSRPVTAVLKVPVICVTVYFFLSFAWIIGVNATVGVWLEQFYGFGPRESGIFYVSGIVGTMIGLFIGHFIHDGFGKLYAKRHDGRITPEARLIPVYIGQVMMIVALIVMGFALEHRWHYMTISVFYAMQIVGIIIGFGGVSAYLLDAYPEGSGEIGAWTVFGRLTGGFMAVYIQLNWVLKSGPARVFGSEAGIVCAAGLIILFLQFASSIRIAQGPMKFATA